MGQSLRTAPTKFLVLFAIFGLGFGGFLMAWGIQTVTRQYASRNWPATQGTVTDKEYESGTNGGGGYEYTYEYQVDGSTYQGSFDDDVYHDRSHVGASVDVWYDPEHPEVSTTVQGLGIWHFAPLLMGPVAVFLGLVPGYHLWLRLRG